MIENKEKIINILLENLSKYMNSSTPKSHNNVEKTSPHSTNNWQQVKHGVKKMIVREDIFNNSILNIPQSNRFEQLNVCNWNLPLTNTCVDVPPTVITQSIRIYTNIKKQEKQ